jgi:formylglycine-generating enzyme required for sulfatase activity/Tfp pilus assembly protein PilF
MNRKDYLVTCALVSLNVVIPASGSGGQVSYELLVAQTIDYLKKGDDVKAQANARKLIKLNRNRYEGYLYLGITYHNQSDYNAAESVFVKALNLAPEVEKPVIQSALNLARNTRGYTIAYANGVAAEREGLTSKAARKFAEAVRCDPTNSALAIKAAKLFVELGDFLGAAQLLVKARDAALDDKLRESLSKQVDALRPNFNKEVEAQFTEGLRKLKAGQSNEALLILERVAPLINDRNEGLTALFVAQYASGSLASAVTTFKAWCRSYSRDVKALAQTRTCTYYGNSILIRFIGESVVRQLIVDTFGQNVISILTQQIIENRTTTEPVGLVLYPKLRAYVASLKKIPAGTFQMGGMSHWIQPNEKPVHTVTLSAFYMGATPVTAAVWKEYCAATGTTLPTRYTDNDDDLPVVHVSWNDIMGEDGNGGFCAWASYIAGFRLTLPTEAQWEYAARGGIDGKEFQWGDSWDNRPKWMTTYDNKPKPVNRSEDVYLNYFGLTDMCGNVMQWCSDSPRTYSSENQTNPVGPPSKERRNVRGSAFDNGESTGIQLAHRSSNQPDYHWANLGFRLAAVPQ